MPPIVQEWLNLVLRWAHVIAAIMWIGDSFLFMWMDESLEPPGPGRAGDVAGQLWMTHSGGFYEVVKRRALDRLPARLHWFRWPSYSTWITGVLLLLVVYGLGSRAMLLDASSALPRPLAIGIVLALIVAAVPAYLLLLRLPWLADDRALGVAGLAIMSVVVAALQHLLTPRAALLVAGAMLGTVMTSSVLLCIIPAQRRMIEATRAGRPVDTSYGARAKQRSIHNHYLTLPVLFTMLSSHFPSLYGHPQAWAVFGLLSIAGVGAKSVMSRGRRAGAPAYAATLAGLAGVMLMTAPWGGDPATRALAAHAPVDEAAARAIVQMRCVTCHARHPANGAFAAPPNGVALEQPDQIEAWAPRILERVYVTRTMPLGNLTGITDEERATLGAWAYQQRARH